MCSRRERTRFRSMAVMAGDWRFRAVVRDMLFPEWMLYASYWQAPIARISHVDGTSFNGESALLQPEPRASILHLKQDMGCRKLYRVRYQFQLS